MIAFADIENIECIVKDILISRNKINIGRNSKHLKLNTATVDVTYKGRGSDIGAVKLLVNINSNDKKIVLFWAPNNSDAKTHLLSKINWSNQIYTLYKKNVKVDSIPFPIGSGGIQPVVHYWSEYVGVPLISLLPYYTIDATKITANLAMILGAKQSTITDTLNLKSLSPRRTYKKIDSITFHNTDFKKILFIYLADCNMRLKKAKYNFEEFITLYKNNANICNDNLTSKVDYLLTHIHEINVQQKRINQLKTSLKNLEQIMGDGVLVHNDLINLYNITYEGVTNTEVNYEGQPWFVGTWLPTGRNIKTMIGSKRMYPYLILKHLEGIRNIGKSPRLNPYTKQVEVRQLLLDLEKMLVSDYNLGSEKIDNYLEKIADLYFSTKRYRVLTTIEYESYIQHFKNV